jgi:hypothetical protein
VPYLGGSGDEVGQGLFDLGVPSGLQPAVGVDPEPGGRDRGDRPAQCVDDLRLLGYAAVSRRAFASMRPAQ